MGRRGLENERLIYLKTETITVIKHMPFHDDTA
jgi:hypothetical protein